MIVKETIIDVGKRATEMTVPADRNNKQTISKKCVPFTYCVTEINSTQLDNTKDADGQC